MQLYVDNIVLIDSPEELVRILEERNDATQEIGLTLM